MLDLANRTFICSVVFIDLVGYSKKPVAEQIRTKASLTNNLSTAIKDIPVNDRIILDTGDGAAISFLGDPEDALFTTLSLREAMVQEGMSATQVEASGEDAVRMGINLGPVKLVKDINGHPNIIGDGINVSQRIMSFARPGQIVVSRSYYDVVSNLATEYAKLFTYEGSRTDKHVREHEIYVVGHNEGALNKARDGIKDRAASTTTNVRRAAADATPGTTTVTLTVPNFARDRKTLTMVALGLGAVVAVLAVMVVFKKSDQPPAPVAAAPAVTAPVPATVPVPAAAPTAQPAQGAHTAGAVATPPGAPAPAATSPLVPSSQPPAKGEPGKAESPKNDAAKPAIAGAKPEPGKAPDAAKAADPKAAAGASAGGLPPATLVFAVQPWGEIFVNGKSIGVSPPVKSHKLPPGKYRIEVRNTTFPVHAETYDLKARDEITIRHRFQ